MAQVLRFILQINFMNSNSVLEKIIAFADQAHGKQMRKYSNERYIVHPIRVMKICRNYSDELPVLAAAILHDVLEDTSTGESEILNFLSDYMLESQAIETLKLVVELTDVYTKSDYPHLNRKQRKILETERLGKISSTAQTIKYADIIDNTIEIVAHDRGFAPKYLKECKAILEAADEGNPKLREEALEGLKEGFEKLKSCD